MTNMRRTEDQHNTPEQVLVYTKNAVAVADEADLTPEDRAVLLPQIMSQLASKQVFYEQINMAAGLHLPRPQG